MSGIHKHIYVVMGELDEGNNHALFSRSIGIPATVPSGEGHAQAARRFYEELEEVGVNSDEVEVKVIYGPYRNIIGNPEHRPKNERTKIEAIRSLRKRYGLGLYEAKVLFESYTMHVYGRESGGITDQDLAMIGLWITHVQGIMGRTEGQYLNRLLRILVPQGTGARLLMIDWDGIYDATLEHIHGEFKVNG